MKSVFVWINLKVRENFPSAFGRFNLILSQGKRDDNDSRPCSGTALNWQKTSCAKSKIDTDNRTNTALRGKLCVQVDGAVS